MTSEAFDEPFSRHSRLTKPTVLSGDAMASDEIKFDYESGRHETLKSALNCR